jgi:ATP-dependent Lhr-like helicase
MEWVVIDEVHELADNKRGAHLSITLERLSELSNFTRIGMSATIHPVEEVARYLVGLEGGKGRKCYIADVSYAKKLDIKVISPKDLLSGEATGELYRIIKKLIDTHRSTLVFTNTRSGAERVSYHLSRMSEEKEEIGAHHGSLSREVRLSVEEQLKLGKLKAVACSSSLELGIDIGALDLCILVGSPKSITRLLQRSGRSGHELERIAKGRLIVLDRDDLVEGTVLAKCAMERKLDRVQIIGPALDVLAQQIVGMSLSKRWNVKEAYEVIRRAYPYRNLSYRRFLSVLRYLSGKNLAPKVYPKIWLSSDEDLFGRRGGTVRGIYMTHVGTIPSESAIQVYSGKKWIGKIDEVFLERLYKNDIFVLGGKTWVFLGASGARALVRDAAGRSPTIPSWIGELLPLAYDSAMEVGKFRERILKRLSLPRKEVLSWLQKEYNLDRRASIQIYEYFIEQYRYAGDIPHHRNLVIEEYWNDGQQNLIFHALFGRRTNDALSRAYAYKISKLYHTNVGVTINDNGWVLRLPEGKSVGKIDVRSEELEDLLRKSIRRTELFKRRFRHCATRGLMILRSYKGYEITAGKQQRSSDVVLKVIEKDFPLIDETFREIGEEVMDLPHAKEVLKKVENGEIKVRWIKLPFPSPFAHNLVALQAADVVLMESRKELLLELHRRVLKCIKEEKLN